MKGDKDILRTLAGMIARTRVYTSEGKNAFRATPLLQEGIILNLLRMGRLAGQLSPEIKDATPEIPWHGLENIHDLLVDDFAGGVDLEEAWTIATKDLPDIQADLAACGHEG